ncbi:MBL fold metallo-hydrolase [Desulforhopalus singaporensis]|uniref:L-ascorbate metabolism protein UlaG, beta-lactamase superfamily n=1 Tax=Desulforhopalus singaporensis TaxID=91360 RepID=A0A1H0PRM6_9BACT|nr:MBL fold metallo-hydrolase [Desulforhopalus singaporensis]SDP07644.1 L-ascorbate metabolism protein UlaG, beta-lactamase superfamily [Desulforhopalus singaporensis]
MEKSLLMLFSWMLVVAACLGFGASTIFNQSRFGKLPRGEELERLKQSPNYGEGTFQYPISTPIFSQNVTTFSIICNSFLSKHERLVPDEPLPTVKTDLKELDPQQDIVVWLGHSAWFVQLDGKRILIDPILSGYAAPFSFINRAFDGTTIYQPEDMPEIDCLLISHDHWDHLDYPTVKALQAKVKQVICPLGIGISFEYWGYPKEKVHEKDWYDKVAIDHGVIIHLLPARHYSRRLFAKNRTLWAGFALQGLKSSIFFSGDSGHGSHFSDIGQTFNGFDLALLDCGQYDQRWSYIHMTPEEAAQAAQDLGARTLIPSHVGRFTIANHPWDEPFKRIADASRNRSYRLVTPRIGEPVTVGVSLSRVSYWWLEMNQL